MYDVFVFIVPINDDKFYDLYKASVRFPYWLFSHFPAQDFLCRIFQSCIFTSCIFVPHFPVSHFPALQFCAVFSIPAFSSPAFFLVPHFHVSHFQSPHVINQSTSLAISAVAELLVTNVTHNSGSFFYPDIGNAAKHQKIHACINKVASVNKNVRESL